jgi:hypothetical protein
LLLNHSDYKAYLADILSAGFIVIKDSIRWEAYLLIVLTYLKIPLEIFAKSYFYVEAGKGKAPWIIVYSKTPNDHLSE